MINTTITPAIHNALVDTFNERAKNFGYKGKRLIEYQQEFFCGAVRALDVLGSNTESCVTPKIFFAISRGEMITKIEEIKV